MSLEELVRACLESGDADAWLEFVQRLRRFIARIAFRTASQWMNPTRELIEDLVQETFLKLCADNYRLLRVFEPNHPDALFGYVKSVTENVVRDHFKAANAQKRGSGEPNLPLAEVEFVTSHEDPGCLSELDRGVLLNEINQYLTECAPGSENEKNRTIFFLYYRQGLSANAIAALPSVGLSTKGVESVILRLTRLVRARIMALSEPETKPKSTCS